MNPELPQAGRNIETQPYIPGGVERASEYNQQNPEIQQNTSESVPAQQTIERTYQGIPAALPVVAPPTSQPDPQLAAQAADDAMAPLVAADEDLIEKEWVDKVKKIIALTKDDPYERSRVVTQLQADYLKKRYNKVLGKSRDSE